MDEGKDAHKTREELLEELERLRKRNATLEAATQPPGLILAESEASYRQLIELFPESIAIHQNGKFVYVNDAGLKLIGATDRAQIIGKPLLDVVHPDFRPAVIARARQTQQGQPTTLLEEKFIRLDGRPIDVEVVAIPVTYRGEPATQVVVRDITERKRFAEALLQNEERLRLASEAGDLGVWEWDIPTGKVNWSDNLEELHGMEPGGFGGTIESFRAMIYPDDRPAVMVALNRAIKDGQKYAVEVRTIGPYDGKLRWLATQAQTFFDEAGQPMRMVGVTQNITERKRAENDLRESEARFRSMADSAPVLLWVSGPDTLCNFFNQSWLSFTGRTMEQEIGNGWAEGVHPADFEKCLQIYLSSFEARKPFEMEYRLRRWDGQWRWLLDKGVPRFQPDGSFAGYIGSCIDIEERKRAEERQRFLADASKIMAASLDYEQTLQNVARLTTRLADWCAIEMVSGTDGSLEIMALAHRDPDLENQVYRLRKNLQPYLTENYPTVRVARTGQPELFHQMSTERLQEISPEPAAKKALADLGLKSAIFVPLVARGRTLGVLSLLSAASGHLFDEQDFALAQDLAYRAALAVDNTRLYREAQEAAKDREEFLSVAAHELKTPLTGLRGFAQLLSRQLTRPETLDPVRLGRVAQVIQEQSDKLTRLIEQLLDVSRIEAGRLGLDKRRTDLYALVEGVVNLAQSNTDKHTLRVVSQTAPLEALVDALRFEQVVTNLVDNAIKYSPEGGPVTVEITLSDPQTVRLSVTDQGLGIPAERRERIFDRFYQAHERAYLGGMGLGLHISRQIVELHRGRIEVEFPSEGGSRFIVNVPVQAEEGSEEGFIESLPVLSGVSLNEDSKR